MGLADSSRIKFNLDPFRIMFKLFLKYKHQIMPEI
jgi:hypothetical protein